MKAVQLKVAGAFHTPMMARAAEALRDALANCEITLPADIRIIANVDAGYYEHAEQIRSGLVRQLVEPILWQTCMEKLIGDGVETYYEIGRAAY